MKIVLYIILVLAVIGGGVFAWLYFSKPAIQNNSVVSLLPSSSLPTPSYSITDTFPKSDKISIGTAQGSVEVKNFYSTLVDTEEGLAIIEDNSDDKIAYDRSTSEFFVYLKTADASQTKAESNFLKILGIGQGDACKLDVSIVATGQTGEKSLSFCPGH